MAGDIQYFGVTSLGVILAYLLISTFWMSKYSGFLFVFIKRQNYLKQQKARISKPNFVTTPTITLELCNSRMHLSCGRVNSPIVRVSDRGWAKTCPGFLSFYDSKIYISLLSPANRSTNQCRQISKYASPRNCQNCWSNLPRPPFELSLRISSRGLRSTYSLPSSSPWFPREVEDTGGEGKVLENRGEVVRRCSLGVGLISIIFARCSSPIALVPSNPHK